MSTLNIMCAICSEFYKANDTVYSTTQCGHLFHQQCLFRWLQRSLTCPQCRRICQKQRVHRVYLNFGDCTFNNDEINSIDTGPNWIFLDESNSFNGVLDPQPMPTGAIKLGTDDEGNDTYVARVFYQEDLLPANYVPNKKGAYAPWGCHSRFVTNNIELLINCKYSWETGSNGNVPPNAIVTGYTESGENLYTGRGIYENLTLGGKVHPSHKVLYMPYKDAEVNTTEYEVLVQVFNNEEK